MGRKAKRSFARLLRKLTVMARLCSTLSGTLTRLTVVLLSSKDTMTKTLSWLLTVTSITRRSLSLTVNLRLCDRMRPVQGTVT